MGNNRQNMAMGGDELPDVSWDDWDGLQDPSPTVWGGRGVRAGRCNSNVTWMQPCAIRTVVDGS